MDGWCADVTALHALAHAHEEVSDVKGGARAYKVSSSSRGDGSSHDPNHLPGWLASAVCLLRAHPPTPAWSAHWRAFGRT